jgi:hypothetical protein
MPGNQATNRTKFSETDRNTMPGSKQSFYFLISSLPGLLLGEKPKLTSEEFLDQCASALPPSDFDALCEISLLPRTDEACCEAERRWQDIETYIRNQIVRQRSTNKPGAAEEWLRDERDAFPGLQRVLNEALDIADPAQREYQLDAIRWQQLDDFEVTHEFDFNKLATYRLKLLIAEKWAAADVERGHANLTALLKDLVASAHDHRIAVDESNLT